MNKSRNRETCVLIIYHRPYVTGKDLVGVGLTPGEDFSEGLKFAHKLRLAGVNKENALKQTISFIKKMRKKYRKRYGMKLLGMGALIMWVRHFVD